MDKKIKNEIIKELEGKRGDWVILELTEDVDMEVIKKALACLEGVGTTKIILTNRIVKETTNLYIGDERGFV